MIDEPVVSWIPNVAHTRAKERNGRMDVCIAWSFGKMM